MQGISLALSAGSAVLGAAGAYQQSSMAKKVAEVNASTAEMNAQDAQRRGEQDAQRIARQGRQVQGQQRAALSARGIDIGEGTGADLIDQTDFFSLADQATARDNAAKEAWNYRAQRNSYQAQADAQKPGMAAFSSLLGSAGSVADKWYRFSGKPGGANPGLSIS